MLEIAIREFQIKLVMVMGHTGCLAVGQLLDGDKGGPGGMHRIAVQNAIYRAKAKNPVDLYRASVKENVEQSMHHLLRDSYTLHDAVRAGNCGIIGCVYDMQTGEVEIVPLTKDRV